MQYSCHVVLVMDCRCMHTSAIEGYPSPEGLCNKVKEPCENDFHSYRYNLQISNRRKRLSLDAVKVNTHSVQGW